MAAPPKTASDIIRTYLNRYGLGGLTDWALKTYTQAGGGNTGMAAITAELPNTKMFKARFPAYQKLAEEGKGMSIDQMLQYEQTARSIFHASGIPAGFYDTPQDLAKFMLNDVSTTELQARVQDAQQALVNSPQDVRNQLSTLFGIDQGHLTAFFLDPKVAEPLIAQKFTAAQIAAQAGRSVGQLSTDQAMQLARFGVTDQTAAQGFGKLGTEAGLFEQQVAGEESVPLQTQIEAQFEGNTQAQLAFQKRAALRTAAFQGQSGFAQTQQGVGGLEQARGA